MDMYPEHEKLRKVRDESRAIREFFEWLHGSKGYFVATYPEHSTFAMHIHEPIEDLVPEFFGVDRVKLEQEKRDMLNRQRTLDATSTE